MTADPSSGRVRLVVLNYDGGSHVVRCVEHLVGLDWPADQLEIVVLDNASRDGSADEVAARFTSVRVVRRPRNDGFPANNDALRDLRGVRYVGLVNNDAFVEPDYLARLVAALDADPSLGAACPLMVFESRFADVELVTSAERPGRGDPRALGVRLDGVRIGGTDVWGSASFVEGGHGRETGRAGSYEWTGERSLLRVPVPRDRALPESAELLLSALTPRAVEVRSPTGEVGVLEIGTRAASYRVPLGGPAYDVVNNAGSIVCRDGYGADRGFGEQLDARFDEPCDVFAWCGGAVLLRPAYLADVGLFAERFFLYYEDTDLSWRGKARGWSYRYVPGAVVRHLHAASSVEGSARFAFYTERNRLMMLLRNAPASMVRDALRTYVSRTYDAARRDVAGALVQRRRPNALPVGRRLRALGGVALEVPASLRARRHLRSRQTVPDAELVAGLRHQPGGL